ncbi:MAG: DUF222 domain-containing protein [Actinomycetaceae bacterium]|nr:DUF222 domain-containing protein [Actinomycetaceae bacterium]
MDTDIAPQLDQKIRDIRMSISHLLGEDTLSSLNDDSLLEAVRQVESLGRIVDGARALLAGEVDSRCRPGSEDSLCAQRGARSSNELLRSTTGASTSTITRRLRLGRTLRSKYSFTGEKISSPYSLIRTATENGVLAFDAAVSVMSILGPAQVARVHPDLVEVAQRSVVGTAIGFIEENPSFNADTLRAMCVRDPLLEGLIPTADTLSDIARLWLHAIDPDGKAPREENTIYRRGLSLTPTKEGLVHISGDLLPEVGAQLNRLIDAVTNPRVDDAIARGELFANEEYSGGAGDNPNAPSTEGTDLAHLHAQVTIPDDHSKFGRSRKQKIHDAFASILTRAASLESMPLLGGAPPTLVVTMCAEDLENHRGIARLEDAPYGTHQEAASVISAAAASQLCCSGVVERVFTDRNGQILDITTSGRLFTPYQRRAIAARDGGCIIPGCTIGPNWCEVHHVTEYAAGGATDINNGVLLCWYHHRFLSHIRWKVRMNNGLPEVKAPSWYGTQRTWIPAQSSFTRTLHFRRHRVEEFWEKELSPQHLRRRQRKTHHPALQPTG